MAGGNVYLPWKRVPGLPPTAIRLAAMSTASGDKGGLHIVDEQPYPSLYLSGPDGVARIGLVTLMASLLGSVARETDRWDPLEQDLSYTPPDGTFKQELWGNAQVSVSIARHDGGAVLSYHQRDRAPVRDWRIGQRVKNELCGPDWEAVELYPAEDRLMDVANESWLFSFSPEHPLYAVLGALGHQTREVGNQADLDTEQSAAVQRDQGDDDAPH